MYPCNIYVPLYVIIAEALDYEPCIRVLKIFVFFVSPPVKKNRIMYEYEYTNTVPRVPGIGPRVPGI